MTDGIRVLQRVVFPGSGHLDMTPLYLETRGQYGAEPPTGGGPDQQVPGDPGETGSAVRWEQSRARGMGNLAARRSAVISAGRRVSFGSYFNAFPASYWRRWSILDHVLLRVRVDGACTIVVYRSTARGISHPVETVDLDDAGEVDLTLPLKQFIDGGWYWFDIVAGRQDVTLQRAEWAARADRAGSGRMSVGITTFNRPDFCVEGLRVLAEAPEVLEILDRLYVVDQGSDRVEDHPDFSDVAKRFGGKLSVIDQGNLGGSGGFSRAMDETLRAGDSAYVLLLDDDVVTEPESLLRAATFADLARRPTIVGGHMFSLYDRSVLHAFGESVSSYDWWWGPAPRTHHGHDLGRSGLRQTPWLHRRVDVDYNGWWMCLIPTEVVRQLGFALPMFIKWDDAEYGLRARQAGHPTVSLPGVAVWHVPWQDKNDALDWQAYYHVRNRLVAALLHSPYPRGGGLVAEFLRHQVRHLLSMQYSTAALRLAAIEDVLGGPEHLHPDRARTPAELRALAADFPDSQTASDLEDFPAVRRSRLPRKGKEPTSPAGRRGKLATAVGGVARQVRPVKALARRHPETVMASQDAQWWLLAGVDGALVSAPDGTVAAWYRRDPRTFRTLLRRSMRAHLRLAAAWPRLRIAYRLAGSDLTSAPQWRQRWDGTSGAAAPSGPRPAATDPSR